MGFSLFCQVGDRLDECNRFESNWINAVNLCEMAAEAAYNTGVFITSDITEKAVLNMCVTVHQCFVTCHVFVWTRGRIAPASAKDKGVRINQYNLFTTKLRNLTTT